MTITREVVHTEVPDHAGVAFHPPVLLLLALLLGLVARWLTLLRFLPEDATVPLGPVVVAASFGGFIWAVATMRRAGASIPTSEPTEAIVMRGPYGWSRNPIYLSMVALQVGVGIWANSGLLVLRARRIVGRTALVGCHFAGRTLSGTEVRRRLSRVQGTRTALGLIGDDLSSEDAAVSCGMSPPVGGRWFREGGGMPPISLAPRSARYLSFAEREEIAIRRAQGGGVRDIARRLRRAPSTVSRELRRNAATRSGGLAYRASTVSLGCRTRPHAVVSCHGDPRHISARAEPVEARAQVRPSTSLS